MTTGCRLLTVALALHLAGGVLAWSGCGDQRGQVRSIRSFAATVDAAPPATRFTTEVRLPHRALGMNSGAVDELGRPVRIACAVCHEALEPRRGRALATQPRRFHRAVTVDHGGQTCRTCHAAPRFARLQLGSGQSLSHGRSIELCGQCHSGQLRDYRHGAHGGMSGHWDLDAGGRERNHCIVCHDPHRPAIEAVLPAPRARYRTTERGQ